MRGRRKGFGASRRPCLVGQGPEGRGRGEEAMFGDLRWGGRGRRAEIWRNGPCAEKGRRSGWRKLGGRCGNTPECAKCARRQDLDCHADGHRGVLGGSM